MTTITTESYVLSQAEINELILSKPVMSDGDIEHLLISTERDLETTNYIDEEFELNTELFYNEIVPKKRMYVML